MAIRTRNENFTLAWSRRLGRWLLASNTIPKHLRILEQFHHLRNKLGTHFQGPIEQRKNIQEPFFTRGVLVIPKDQWFDPKTQAETMVHSFVIQPAKKPNVVFIGVAVAVIDTSFRNNNRIELYAFHRRHRGWTRIPLDHELVHKSIENAKTFMQLMS